MTCMEALENLLKGNKLINDRGAVIFIKGNELKMCCPNKDTVYMTESVIHDFKKYKTLKIKGDAL